MQKLFDGQLYELAGTSHTRALWHRDDAGDLAARAAPAVALYGETKAAERDRQVRMERAV
jgi:hypothetical protein